MEHSRVPSAQGMARDSMRLEQGERGQEGVPGMWRYLQVLQATGWRLPVGWQEPGPGRQWCLSREGLRLDPRCAFDGRASWTSQQDAAHGGLPSGKGEMPKGRLDVWRRQWF